MSLLRHALDLAELGLSVFPVGPDCRIPWVPARAGMGGCHLASNKERHIREMWKDGANVAVATGHKSGVFVLDIDVKGSDGFASAKSMGLDPWWISRTPSGGEHWWFIQPRRPIRNRVGFLPGLDIRTDGGSVAAPPSRKPTGSYEWIKDPWSNALTKAPMIFLELIDPPLPKMAPIPRNVSSRYIERAVSDECAKVAATKSGRNQALFVGSASLGRFSHAGLIDPRVISQSMYDACSENGLLKEDGVRSVMATIESGIRAGASSRSDLSPEMRRLLSA